jgi:hypothetical protein
LYDEIRKIDGIGAFMAGQICVDIGYIDKELFDENELAPAGPGCVKGLNYLYKGLELNPGSATANQEKNVQSLLGNIRNKQELIWKHLGFPAPTFGTMSLMTIENLMCEASKYISLTRNPKTKGRQRYRQRPRVEQVATIVTAFDMSKFVPPVPKNNVVTCNNLGIPFPHMAGGSLEPGVGNVAHGSSVSSHHGNIHSGNATGGINSNLDNISRASNSNSITVSTSNTNPVNVNGSSNAVVDSLSNGSTSNAHTLPLPAGLLPGVGVGVWAPMLGQGTNIGAMGGATSGMVRLTQPGQQHQQQHQRQQHQHHHQQSGQHQIGAGRVRQIINVSVNGGTRGKGPVSANGSRTGGKGSGGAANAANGTVCENDNAEVVVPQQNGQNTGTEGNVNVGTDAIESAPVSTAAAATTTTITTTTMNAPQQAVQHKGSNNARGSQVGKFSMPPTGGNVELNLLLSRPITMAAGEEGAQNTVVATPKIEIGHMNAASDGASGKGGAKSNGNGKAYPKKIVEVRSAKNTGNDKTCKKEIIEVRVTAVTDPLSAVATKQTGQNTGIEGIVCMGGPSGHLPEAAPELLSNVPVTVVPEAVHKTHSTLEGSKVVPICKMCPVGGVKSKVVETAPISTASTTTTTTITTTINASQQAVQNKGSNARGPQVGKLSTPSIGDNVELNLLLGRTTMMTAGGEGSQNTAVATTRTEIGPPNDVEPVATTKQEGEFEC